MRLVGTAILLCALWLLMSGLYKPLILTFGAASVALVLFIMWRMDAKDGSHVNITLKPFGFIAYLIWLLVEIAKANWAVTKTILSPSMPIRQHFFAVSNSQQSDLCKVLFANSITLTPGTLTVETEGAQFLVHALSYCDADVEALADMDARVTATEWVSAT